MNKFCVFCGEKPNSKNKEHILPTWLLEMTGDPKRTAKFGFYKDSQNKFSPRKYSFDSFVFPACQDCNNRFSALEGEVKNIIDSMLRFDSLSMHQFSILFDWLDKVRIGLWLAFIYLDKNICGISPKFHITRRIGMHDRMMIISLIDSTNEGLNFIGCDFPIFYFTPSCFALRINRIILFNISYAFLFSRRIGFPYPLKSYLSSDQLHLYYMASGLERVILPLIRKPFQLKGTKLYQPMFDYISLNDSVEEFYQSDYIIKNCINWDDGIGKIFMENVNEINVYPVNPSKAWIPKYSYDVDTYLKLIPLEVLNKQLYIVDNLLPLYDNLPLEQRKRHKAEIKNQKIVSRKFIKMLINKQ